MLVALVVVWPLASVSLTVKENVPVAVGVPLITPEADRLSPVGRLPLLTENVYGRGAAGRAQRVACRPCWSSRPAVSAKVSDGAGTIVIDVASVALSPALSVTLTVKEYVPAVVGVPESVPVDELIVHARRQ